MVAGDAADSTLHRALGLTDAEAGQIEVILGRAPNHLELAMYAVMWSEHCSYKSSRIHLRRLPTEGPDVLVGPGENAGVVDVGDGIAAAIRIESHNHPSAVEPYQGAATGVGGILRDIFTMGARPIALMDPLFFGPLDDARNRFLVEGVVSGISGYGNAVGVPTVGGELTFSPSYSRNPLVNVLCLGLLRKEHLVLAQASGEGNVAVLLGLVHRARRHRRGERAGVGRVRRVRGRRFRQAPERAGGRPLRGEAPDRGVPRAAREGPRGGHPGPGRGRASPVPPRRRRVGPAWAWTSTSRPCPAARPPWSPSRS